MRLSIIYESDEVSRDAERASQADPTNIQAQATRLVQQLRAGRTDIERLQAMAFGGNEAAALVLGWPTPEKSPAGYTAYPGPDIFVASERCFTALNVLSNQGPDYYARLTNDPIPSDELYGCILNMIRDGYYSDFFTVILGDNIHNIDAYIDGRLGKLLQYINGRMGPEWIIQQVLNICPAHGEYLFSLLYDVGELVPQIYSIIPFQDMEDVRNRGEPEEIKELFTRHGFTRIDDWKNWYDGENPNEV